MKAIMVPVANITSELPVEFLKFYFQWAEV